MKLIIGLGNPGREYAKTRHNVGFMVIDRLAQRHQITSDRTRFHALVLDGRVADHRCLLIKPMTYMNRSGMAVREAMQFYKLEAEDLIIIVDDIALPAGAIRLRGGGGAGGHNGLTDIEQAIGTRNYARLRIGIDPPGRIPQSDYVLGRFTADQFAAVDPALDRACDCVEAWLGDDLDKVMSKFNAPTDGES